MSLFHVAGDRKAEGSPRRVEEGKSQKNMGTIRQDLRKPMPTTGPIGALRAKTRPQQTRKETSRVFPFGLEVPEG